MRARLATGLAVVLVAGGVAAPAVHAADDPSVVGMFERPFEEPGERCVLDAEGRQICKPAGVSLVPLADGRVLYWDGLEGMEDVRYSTVLEIGQTAQDAVSRVLDLRDGSPSWTTPTPEDGGANPGGNNNEYLPLPLHNNDDVADDGDLFCSDLVQLADGTILTAGGTSWYSEPGVSGVPYGLSELEGLRNARIFDPKTDQWRQAGSMHYGRWYPTLVTLADGSVLVTSGVTKLVKPLYADRPQDSGTNVRQTEVYDPATQRWTLNPPTADKSLPLYPRLHLLPNGKVYYDAGGQTFNPSGQAYDEALWAVASVYDPQTKRWSDKGVPAFGPLQGFRGSGFSQLLTLRPPYTKAQVLAAGGVYGPTPGTYVATDTSTLNTIDTANGDAWSTQATGPMTQPRWYSTAVTLPTGEVVAFSGADRDEVVGPGGGTPIRRAELFDPGTGKWRPLATATNGRTYHNTAVLLPDGRILVGGHAPINTAYARADNTGHDLAGLSPAYRDPSFEIFSPPNLFYGTRPVIGAYPQSMRYGGDPVRIEVSDSARIESVVLVRNPSLTHLVDADQRTVELPIVARDKHSVTVLTPPHGAVAPAGPYWLFANKTTDRGPTPSVSRQVFVGVPAPGWVPKATGRPGHE